MKFTEFPYERPDLEAAREVFLANIDIIKQAESVEATLEAIRSIQALHNELDSQQTLVSIRNSIDTKDEFYDKEMAFWDEKGPIMSEWATDYTRAVLNSPLRQELEAHIPATFFAMGENALRTFEPKVIPLLQKENKLTTEYAKLKASAEIEYKGKVYNIPGMAAFIESTDREERKEVSRLLWGFFDENKAEFDRIYDELVHVRSQIAKELGFKDFVELGYARMNRLDYSREDVEVYRQEILKHVVPVVAKLFKRQQERLGLEELKSYDLPIEYPNGNAKPIGTPEEIVANGVTMYHELSPETAEFIDFMVERDLLDLVTKPAKAGGGYCTYIPKYQAPFIFSNFNGTSGDIDVLTHEAGHAFQVFQSRWIETPECLWPTYESCEIHSMSMEFFAWPWMELFFADKTPKYKFSHLSSGLKFLPYGVLVDHFQHEVYEHPTMTPEERRQTWRRLEKMYLPWRDYDGNQFLEEGGFWFQQGHIFESPFYYIDYTLAQVCAFQFWKRSQVDQDPTAWNDYLKICHTGGTKSFLQIVEEAQLKSPFGEGNLEAVIASINDYLEATTEDSLKV
ncbi:M3 family oligoendopeptidase [Aerococcaceae bacterium NML191219]|nr:M3 family oligoendopeptidase [Aerococcaceae bacterium NML191219]